MNEKRKKLSQEMKVGITLAAISVVFLVTLLIIRNVATVRRPPVSSSVITSQYTSTTGPITSTPSSSTDKPIDEEIDENMERPYRVEATIYRYFYDADVEPGQLALVETLDKGVIPSQGVDYKYGEEKFQVFAAFSGVITKLDNDITLGNNLQIRSADNLTAIYQSINISPALQVDQVISQGDYLGTASSSTLRSDSAIHLHFALMRGQDLINPEKYFGAAITSISS